ncbi:hypothetical protein FUAX_20860 [Fulvitalea axinellae]|uniref:DUF3078 domain-containing protein n=1 Tax=Fulvitalea axinellae TaxID=1182444 RepID=A0AAU9CT88_9BACT|nr:hypothetical protein FUAX_20860 [Fulvitalea axinellae]
MNHFYSRFLAILSFALTLAIAVNAQTEEETDSVKWTKNGVIGITVANAGFSNWSAGGSNSFSLDATGNYSVKRESAKTIWINRVEIAFGWVTLDVDRYPDRKTQDKLDLMTNFGRRVSEYWSVSVTGRLVTQFAAGYQYSSDNGKSMREYTSDIFSPAYLTTTLGANYAYKDLLVVNLSPISGRFTFVSSEPLSEQGLFGVKKGEKFRAQVGCNIFSSLHWKIVEDVVLDTSLNLFADYESITTVDINWPASLKMKVTKLLFAQVGTQMIYDDDIKFIRDDGTRGPALQFRHNISVGINWEF